MIKNKIYLLLYLSLSTPLFALTYYKPIIEKSITIPNANCSDFKFSNYQYGDTDLTDNIYFSAGLAGLLKIDGNLNNIDVLEPQFTCHGEITNKQSSGGWMYYGATNLGFYNFFISNDESVFHKSWEYSNGQSEFYARELKQVSPKNLTVTDEKGTLYLFNNTTGRPVLLNTLNITLKNNENIFYLKQKDQYLYLVSRGNTINRLFVIDTNNNQLSLLRTINLKSDFVTDVEIDTNKLYILHRSIGLEVIDISNRINPIIENNQFIPSGITENYWHEISIIENKFFISTSQNLYQFNIDPLTRLFNFNNYMSFSDNNLKNTLLIKNPSNNEVYMYFNRILSKISFKEIIKDDNTLNEFTSVIDGTGSLIDPQRSLDECQDGCSRDLVTIHSHGQQPSAGLFQVFRIPGVCESVDLNDLGSATVEVRSWAGYGTDSKYYKTTHSSHIIPLKSNVWNLIAFKTNEPLPANTSKTITASCLTDNHSNVTEISGTPMKFDSDYFYGGNASLITHSNNQYNKDAQDGYGRNKDTAVLLRDHKTLSLFQVTNSSSCRNVRFESPVSFNLSWKKWDERNWRGSKDFQDGDIFSFPTDNYWWILKVKAPATTKNKSRIDMICE